MNLRTRLAAIAGALALLLAPTAALANGVEYEVEAAKPTPGPNAPLAKKAKAYGSYCRGFSKKAVAGQKGTPYGNCLTAMARAATSERTARQVCVAFPKAHVAGLTGTEFGRCVASAAKVKKNLG
jgi:hypothetical protein